MDSDNWRVKREPSDRPARDQSQRSPFHQRNSNTRGRGGGYEQRSTPGHFQQGQSREGLRKPVNNAEAEQAIDDGRRLYVGNMPYEATSKDIEKLLEDVADGIQAINISVDPMTGRNPSYCFVDFKSKELAEQVMEEYNGRDFLCRPLKVRPGVRSGTGTGPYDIRPKTRSTNIPFVNDRWNRLGKPEDHQLAAEEGRRLYVGGLPRFENQEETGKQIRELFEAFNVEVVSKLILANDFMKEKAGNYHYCFVDLASAGDAEAAIQALNGKEVWDWHIKVSHTTGASGKLGERRRLFVGGLPEFTDQDATEAAIKEFFNAFQVSKVSKLFLPRESHEEREGSHCYCFVELADEEQTDRAILELDWKEKWDGKVRVKPAISNAKGSQRAGFGGWVRTR